MSAIRLVGGLSETTTMKSTMHVPDRCCTVLSQLSALVFCGRVSTKLAYGPRMGRTIAMVNFHPSRYILQIGASFADFRRQTSLLHLNIHTITK
jgi:hypothetical protein